jgi:hypothetical protein
VDLDIFLELSTKMPVAAETERPMVLRKKCCMIVYAECQMVLNKVFTRLTRISNGGDQYSSPWFILFNRAAAGMMSFRSTPLALAGTLLRRR